MTKTELKQNWNNVLDILSETMDQVQISVYFGALEPHKIVDSEDRIYLISKETAIKANFLSFFLPFKSETEI